jgi:hypothetical protein
MPCVPAPVGPWTVMAPGKMVGGMPALVQGATLNCAFGGVISVTVPGSMSTQVS